MSLLFSACAIPALSMDLAVTKSAITVEMLPVVALTTTVGESECVSAAEIAVADALPWIVGVYEPGVTVGARMIVIVVDAEPLADGVTGFVLNEMLTPAGAVGTLNVTGALKYSKEFTVTVTDTDPPTPTGIDGSVPKEKSASRASYAPISYFPSCGRPTPR